MYKRSGGTFIGNVIRWYFAVFCGSPMYSNSDTVKNSRCTDIQNIVNQQKLN